MALQSKLFRDDPKLQACQTLDSAHVTKNASGGHVGKIQTALAMLDGARISATEIAAQAYGPSTAAAVLAYKQARKIINTSYQKQADDIVGKMTITSLDQEMAAAERAPREVASIRCAFGPGKANS